MNQRRYLILLIALGALKCSFKWSFIPPLRDQLQWRKQILILSMFVLDQNVSQSEGRTAIEIERIGVAVTLLTRILEVLSSNFDKNICRDY
jgi:hypothetical protein